MVESDWVRPSDIVPCPLAWLPVPIIMRKAAAVSSGILAWGEWEECEQRERVGRAAWSRVHRCESVFIGGRGRMDGWMGGRLCDLWVSACDRRYLGDWWMRG